MSPAFLREIVPSVLARVCAFQTGSEGPVLLRMLLDAVVTPPPPPPALFSAATQFGQTALHLACECQTDATGPEMVRVLVDCMSVMDVECTNRDGETALRVALQYQTKKTGPAVVAALLPKMTTRCIQATISATFMKYYPTKPVVQPRGDEEKNTSRVVMEILAAAVYRADGTPTEWSWALGKAWKVCADDAE